MIKIKYPSKIDLAKFNPDIKQPDVKYGLPKNVIYCSKCVISNQRPNSTVEFNNSIKKNKETINFDKYNICDACKLSELKNIEIKWDDREKELDDLCNLHRKNNGDYDCVVPGSGGKDSFYAAHILKYKYQMNPITVTWAPHIYTEWGWKNIQSWIHAGFDNILVTPNGLVHRLLTRLSTEILFHPFQPFIIGQKSIASKIALMHNIKLIFYGENEAEYGNPILTSNVSERSKEFFTLDNEQDFMLSGISVNELIQDYNLSKNDLKQYVPLDLNLINEKKIETHYLGYYLKWHPQSCYYYAMENSNFQPSPERNAGTYSKYNSIDDKIDDLHYYTTGIKFGIGRASYDASQEVRSGDITREEAVNLVKKFDLEYPERFESEIFEYLSINPDQFKNQSILFEQPYINREYFADLTNNFRSPHIWFYQNNSWKLRNIIR